MRKITTLLALLILLLLASCNSKPSSESSAPGITGAGSTFIYPAMSR